LKYRWMVDYGDPLTFITGIVGASIIHEP